MAEMLCRFCRREQLPGMLPGLVTIMHGTRIVLPALEMHGEFRRLLAASCAIGVLLPLAKAAMQVDAADGHESLIQHVWIQSMQKAVPSGDRPVGVGLGSCRSHKLVALR